MNIRNAQSGTCPLETATSENAELEIRSRSFFAFNTNCCIKAAIVTDGAQLSSGQLLEKILDNAVGLCYRYEKLWSHTQKGSDIWRLNHAQGKAVPIDAETAKILQLSRHYCEETAGLFDVSMAPVAELWNFRKAQVPKPAEIAHALETCSFNKEDLRKKMLTCVSLKYKGIDRQKLCRWKMNSKRC